MEEKKKKGTGKDEMVEEKGENWKKKWKTWEKEEKERRKQKIKIKIWMKRRKSLKKKGEDK